MQIGEEGAKVRQRLTGLDVLSLCSSSCGEGHFDDNRKKGCLNRSRRRRIIKRIEKDRG